MFEELAIVRDLLRARVAVVADREFYQRDPAGHLAALRAVSEKLDAAVGSLPTGVDPMLGHYLQRQSYLKAIDWLDAHLGDSVASR